MLIIQETESPNKVGLMCYMCMVFKVVENGWLFFYEFAKYIGHEELLSNHSHDLRVVEHDYFDY